MARTIMDLIHENITPTMVSNAIVETMVDWRSTVMMKDMARTAGQRSKLKIQRNTIEKVLSHFMGCSPADMRVLLNQHFFPEENR